MVERKKKKKESDEAFSEDPGKGDEPSGDED